MEEIIRLAKAQLEEWPEFVEAQRIVLAVSGGADSMVLLHVIHEILQMKDYQTKELIVAHFNHQLRLESDDEAIMVREYAESLGCIFFSGKWGNPSQTNTEAMAREARYCFFADVLRATNAQVLMTAHHLNDLAETFLMRLIRGTSLKGSQGIQARYDRILTNNDKQVVFCQMMRPFVHITKEKIYVYANKFDVPYQEDVTNYSDQYFRNRVRHQILPLLEAENPQFLANIMGVQEQLQHSYQTHFSHYLELEPKLLMYSQQIKGWILYIPAFLALPKAQLKTYLSIFFEERLVTDLPSYSKEAIDFIEQIMLNPNDPNARINLGGTWQAVRQYDYLRIMPIDIQVDLEENIPIHIRDVNEWLVLNEHERIGLFERSQVTGKMLKEATSKLTLTINDSIKPQEFYVRHRERGDKMRLGIRNGQAYHKKVNRIMIDAKIPQDQRAKTWLLCDPEHEIMWCIPKVISQLYREAQTDTITHVFLYQNDVQTQPNKSFQGLLDQRLPMES